MNKFLIIILLLFSIAGNSAAQSSWYVQNVYNKAELFDVYAVDELNVWAVGDIGVILNTTNGGEDWNLQNSGTSNHLNTVFFINASTGFAAGEDLLLRTTNGGLNWNTVFTNDTVEFNSVYFPDAQTGYAAGYTNNDGYIIKTTDGGATWGVGQLINDIGILNDLYFLDPGTGYAVGGNGLEYAILKTTNGGNTWTGQSDTASSMLFSVGFINAQTGYLGGVTKIARTTNGGDSWTFEQVFDNGNVYLNFADQTTGYGFDDLGTFFKTTNSGTTWYYQDSIFYKFSRVSISFGNNLTGWVVGSFQGVGVIYNTTNGGDPVGITPISTLLPDDYYLSQNFPNPFNPVTRIEFAVLKNGFASLRVYDISGREVSVLVNEHLNAGQYSVSFDAQGLSSGVYFYKLEAGEFTDVKRMVFVK